MNRLFIDSNIWIYALSKQGDSRTAAAQKFLNEIGETATLVISYQVINETISVLKKMGVGEIDLRYFIDKLFNDCEVAGFTKETALLASNLRETISVSYWDSQIVASAVLVGCDTIISEDMQDGVRIRDTLTIRNIFKS